MYSELIEEIMKKIPKGNKLRVKVEYASIFSPAYSEVPASWYWQLCPPDKNQIQMKVGFLKWVPIGEFDDDEDLVILYPECYETFLPVFTEALAAIGRSGDIPILKMIDTPAYKDYLQRLVSTRPERY